MSKRRITTSLIVAAVTAVVAGLYLQQPREAEATTERCPVGGTKLEYGPWQHCVKDGIITGVCIKAGTKTFSFNADGGDGCYEVKGIGSDCVYVSGGGTGRDCKEVSHVVVYFDEKKGDDDDDDDKK